VECKVALYAADFAGIAAIKHADPKVLSSRAAGVFLVATSVPIKLAGVEPIAQDRVNVAFKRFPGKKHASRLSPQPYRR
jgi:hypothetical protein